MDKQLQKTDSNQLPAYDLKGALPNLSEAKAIPVDLSSEYWTPTDSGDFKLVFFQEIITSTYTDKDGDTIELPCAVFLEQKANGDLKAVRNGSKRLVASIEDAINDGKISVGTPLRIEFLEKKKNSTNTNLSDRWSIKPLYFD